MAAANIPGAVVAPQGRPPWMEQLLLTLASQGPQTLMGWLEHRQQVQQANANDTAAQLALGALPSTTSAEQTAIAGARGIKGAAQPLLKNLTDLRTNNASVGQANAAADYSRALTGKTAQETAQARELFPLEKKGKLAQIRASNAAAAASESETAIQKYNLTYAQATEAYRKRQAAAEALKAEGDARASQAAATAAERDLNTWVQDRVSKDLERIAATVTNLSQTFGPEVDKSLLQSMASNMITGVPKASRTDLYKMYTKLKDNPNVDLDQLVYERTMSALGLAPEDLTALDTMFAEAGDHPETALRTMQQNGASATQIAKAAGYYLATTGKPLKLPEESKEGVRGVLSKMLQTMNVGFSALAKDPSKALVDTGAAMGKEGDLLGQGVFNLAGAGAQAGEGLAALIEGITTGKISPERLQALGQGTPFEWSQPTPLQLQQMNSGYIRGWAPPDRSSNKSR